MSGEVRTRGRLRWIIPAAVLAVAVGIGVWIMAPRPVDDVAVSEPSERELDAFAETTVLFGHQSVGANVLDGIAAVYARADLPSPMIVGAREGVPSQPGVVHAFVGVNGDPFGKFEAFRDLVDGQIGEAATVALVKLCYTDITSGTDAAAVFDGYTALMAELEAQHPDIAFLYTTVPLSTDRGWKANLKAFVGRDDQMGPADNVVRQQYNELVRAEYADTGRLFDIAAVESTMATDPTERGTGDAPYYVLNAALSSDAGHLNELGARAAAGELIRVVAAAVE